MEDLERGGWSYVEDQDAVETDVNLSSKKIREAQREDPVIGVLPRPEEKRIKSKMGQGLGPG